jgi:hypothetical protein
MNDLDQLLKDFYGKYTTETLTDEKINTIKQTYGEDIDSLLKDLYSKHAGQSLDEQKLNTIKETYQLKKKDPSEVSTSLTEDGESVSGENEALDQSIQDRLNKGSELDLSVFTTGTDQKAKDAVMEAERARVYQEFGIDYAQRQSLLDQKSQIELEKEKAREDLTDAKMSRLGIKQKEGSDQYYIPTDKGIFSGNFLQNLDQAFTGYDYDDESEFRLGSREEAEEYAIKNYEKSDSVVDTEIEDLERKTKPLYNLNEGDVYKALEEQEEDAIKAEEYLNTRMMNSFIDQGFRGDRLNQLVEDSGINTAYVKSKAFMINGEETSPANIEQQIYDRDFINGLQNGSIKVSIDPAVAETEYGRFLKATLDVQSNAGSEISDIAEEFLAGGVSMGSGVLEVAEIVEAPFSDEYMKTGGIIANHVKDYAEQLRNMQRMYKYPGVMEAIRAGAWDDVPALLGKSIAGSSMQIVAMAMARRLGVNPNITLGALGVSATGQKSLELKELRESGKIDIDNFSLALNSIMSGGFEVLYEIPTYQMIGAVQKSLKGAGKKSAKQVAKEVTDNALKDIFVKEPGSEMLTEISTMIVDHVTLTEKTDDAGILAKSFADVVNRVGNAGIAGMGMAAGIRTVGAAGAVGVSALNSIQGKDLTNKIVATYQVVNEDGSLGETKELTGAEYKEWSKDPNNIAGELNGDIKVNRYNSDIASDVDDIANTNSEDVVQANNDVNEAGKEANSLLNEIENDLQEAPGKKAVGQTEEDKKVPSDKISKVKQLFSRMRNIIQETGAKGIQDLEGLTSKFNSIINKAGLSVNDNLTNQNTDNANIQSTETITEIQTEAQAKAVAKALKEGKDPSVVLSQESVGVSKDGKSVSENNITVGKFKSKAAAKKALDNFKKQNSKAAVEERRHAETQKKNNKAFNKVDKKNLDEVSQEEIGGDYNIISASVEGLGDASNNQRNNKLEKVLKKKGLKYKKVQVVENGVSKTAFMVEGMDSAAALDLAVGFGQKSITSSKDGILHRDGTVESFDGNVYTGPNARNGARIVVMNVNGRKVSVRFGTNKPSYSKDFNGKNIEDINSFIEYLPENQKKILGHVLRFFSNIKGLNVRVVKTTSAMKKQLEVDGYPADKINSIASNRAFYRAKDGTMVLNLQNMSLNTPFHEIVHPLVDFIKLENPELYSRIEEMVAKAEPKIPGSPFRKRWLKNGRRKSGSYLDWVKDQDTYKSLPLDVQIEEAFAEMIGDAAANQFMKDNSKMKQLKDFLAEILEYFNLPTNFLKDKEVTDLRLEDIKNVGQLRGNLGAVLARGKTVSVGGVDFNVSKPKNTKEVDDSIREQVNSQQHGESLGVTEVINLEDVETQEIRFQPGDYTPNFDQNKVKRGNISEFNGQKAMLMCIDRSVSGTVESPSGVVKEFNGGLYYSYQDGTGVWAFAGKAAASKVINKSKESDGLIFLTLMSPQSIDGTIEMFDYVMDEVDNAIKKRKVKRKVVLDFINKKLNLKTLQSKLSKEGISKKKVKSIKEFRDLILSLDGAFDVRKDLVSKMISGKDLSSWGIPTREEMYSFVNQGDIKDLTGNPVVAAIRIDTESGFIDSRESSDVKDHPTYPYVVKGEPLMVFDQAVDASELWSDLNLADKYLINPKTGQPYSEGTTTARRNAAIMMATPVVDVRAQAPEVEQVQWQKSKIGRGDLAITNRREEVREAAQDYFDGKINQEEYLEIVQENSPIKPITQFIDPANLEDIKTAVGSKVEGRLDVPIQEGTKVGLRLDIPAYTNKNIWAITVHEDGRGKAMSYTNVARINNVEFISSPKVALGIARGKLSKSTIARMLGEWSPIDGADAKARGENAKQIVVDVMNDPSWSQIGMNPFRHSYFYDRLDGMPVVGADQVVQIGGLVYAKNAQKTTPFDERFEDKRTGLRFQVEDNDGFTGGRNQYGRFNVMPSKDYVTATSEDLSLENVAGLSGKGNWAIITGTVEADGSYDDDVNLSNNARLYRELVEEFGAENIVITDGVYLNKDQGPSYFISGITENRAMQIGKNFDQEGVLTRRGNIFTDGSGMNPASEKVYVGKEALAQDGNSTTPDGVTFSLDINWKSKVPLSDGIRAQVAGERASLNENIQNNLIIANEMEELNQGDAEKLFIKRATGWERGADGKWRYELEPIKFREDIISLSDGKPDFTKFKRTTKEQEDDWLGPFEGDYVAKLKDIIDAKDLFEAYGEKKKNPNEKSIIKFYKAVPDLDIFLRPGRSEGGLYRALNQAITVEYTKNTSKKEILEIIAHEVQHHIQQIEGFSEGQSFTKAYYKGRPTKSYLDYFKSAGEVEARNVETRLFMDPVRRKNTLLSLTEDVAREDQIRLQVSDNTITEDQLTLLKSTYSEIESKYPDIQINEGMIKMYHYSDMELDVVDPRSAVMNSYSKQEYRTWGRSRVFFYTDPNIKEGVVGGHYKNTTVFPIDRLYPLTEDPLGLNEVAREVIEVKRNSGDKTQATITLDATTLESADMAISKFRSLTKDMGLNYVIDFGEVTENYRYKRNEDGTTDRAGVESISFTVTYPLGSENINSLVKETFDNSRFEKIDPQTQPINTFEEVAKIAESLGFQGFIYDHVGGKTVSSWHPVEILDDRFQVNDQDQNDVYVSGLGAIMWDLTKPIIDADYALGEWATKIKDKDRPYSIRATQLFSKPKGMHSNAEIKEMVIASRGKLDEQMFIANKNQKNLRKVVKEEIERIKATPEYQQATAQQQEAMLSNLTPEGLNDLIGDINKIMELPEQSKLRQAVMQVRDHIDTLSTYLYENGLVSGPMRYTIEGNLGFYLTRAYKKYESSSWRQTDQEVIRRAELFIADKLMSDKSMSKKDAMIRAKQMVDNLIKDKISVTSFKRNTGIGSSMTRVNDIFKERNEDLPKEIRDLLGEINEPFENYVNTISKLSRTVTSHQLYEDLIQMGMGKFIADPNIDDDKTSQVPGIENKLEGKKWGPLEGKFVDNEMFAMLNAYESNALFDSKAYKLWMTFVYGSKKFATVHNPGTHAVNLIGNTFFSIANGHVDPVKFIDAARTAIGEITNLSGKEREAFYQELVSLGVVSSSASLAEIVQIGQDIAAGKDVTSFLDKMNQGKVKKVATIPLRAVRSLDSIATKAYQAEDDVFKIFGFITEKARYMDAGMSEAEATAIAARNTRNTYPNYDMVPSIVRAIGRSPIIGTFVAFQSEAIRCTKNALQLSLQEMGSDNPKVKLMGAKRMAFSLSALTFMETLTATAMSMLFGMGGDDEDDDIETYGLRHLTAPWDKDSKLVPIEKGYFTPDHEGYSGENNGNAYVQYMNVSRLSGGGIIKDALRVAFSDMNTPDKQNAIARIGKTLATTFLSQDMALQVIEEVRQNKGNKVYNPTDDLNKILLDVAMYIGKDLGPGVIKRAKAINDSMKEHSDKITYHEILATVGLRISTIDVNKALYFRSRDLYSDMRSRSESQGYDLRVKDLSLPNALRPGTDTFDPKMSLYFNNLVDVVATARRYGVPLSEGKNNCREILRDAGVPSHVIDKVMYNVYNGKNRDSLLIMYK